jgi:predicted TIM-barrel fold metal-dependent hydrolase
MAPADWLPENHVFDFHVRLAHRPGSTDRLSAVLSECGIERAAVCAGGIVDPETLSRWLIDGGHAETDADNDAVLDASEASGGRLVPFYFANPHRPATEYAKRAAEFRGLEVSPAVHGVPLDNDRMTDLARIAADAGHPVYVVCLIRPGCGVADLAILAESCPDTTFVLGHGGTGNIDFHAISLIKDHPNILLETSGGYTTVISDAISRLGPRRLLFGSEFPLQHPSAELAKFRAIGVSSEDWTLISWANAMRILDCTGEES